MSTVTARPAYGSVDGLAGIIRRGTPSIDLVYSRLTGVLGALIDDGYTTDSDKVTHVRNALAAAELVVAELRAAGR
jgi:hypothetical protein